MLNKEKYAEEILDIVCNGNNIGIIDGHPICCDDINCKDCDINNDCDEEFKKWANSEYNSTGWSKTDWSKVAVDTRVLVSNDGKVWYRNYFAKYKNGKIYTYNYGSTSWSSHGTNIGIWKYAKLAK